MTWRRETPATSLPTTATATAPWWCPATLPSSPRLPAITSSPVVSGNHTKYFYQNFFKKYFQDGQQTQRPGLHPRQQPLRGQPGASLQQSFHIDRAAQLRASLLKVRSHSWKLMRCCWARNSHDYGVPFQMSTWYNRNFLRFSFLIVSDISNVVQFHGCYKFIGDLAIFCKSNLIRILNQALSLNLIWRNSAERFFIMRILLIMLAGWIISSRPEGGQNCSKTVSELCEWISGRKFSQPSIKYNVE